MKRTALFASFALVAGLAAPAVANTIAGTTVSDEDWPFVVEYCETLDDLSNSDAITEEPLATQELSTSTIQLDTLTRGDCEDAGLIEGGVVTDTGPDGSDSVEPETE